MREALLSHYKSMIPSGPLNGIIVLGFCYYVSGPITLQNLVSQGALVIKIEQRPFGDPGRNHFSPEIFNTLTYGQLSVAIDYREGAERQFLSKLLEAVHVIVDNRSIRAKENDPVLTTFLQRDNKDLPVIYCSIDGFPHAKINRLPGLDASAQAYTGFAYSNCFSPHKPLKVGVPILDITTGLLAANYIIANLYLLKQKSLPAETKQVIQIAVSLVGTSVWLQANQFLEAMRGKEYFREGNRDRYAAPFSYYTAKDGLISIATVNESQFKKFCMEVLHDATFHERYPTIQKRIENQEQFEEELNQILKQQDGEHWLAECKKQDISAAPVLTVSQALQQNFMRELIRTSSDGNPLITHGATHSLFSPNRPLPAPQINRDGEDVRSLVMLRSKL